MSKKFNISKVRSKIDSFQRQSTLSEDYLSKKEIHDPLGGASLDWQFDRSQLINPDQEYNDINNADRSVSIIITNDGSSGKPLEVAKLFANDLRDQLTQRRNIPYVQPQGIFIGVEESSHAVMKMELQNSPVLVCGMSYYVENVSQLANNWAITDFDRSQARPFQPYMYRAVSNPDPNSVHAPSFSFILTGTTEIDIPINANEQVRIELFIKLSTLRGSGIIEINRSRVPTGIPEFDLRR